jgi:hypothetical protein
MSLMPESKRTMEGFDFTGHMRVVCEDLVARLPDLSHIDLSRVAIAFCQTRKRVSHGLYASLTPMRFQDGSLVTRRSGRWYTLQRLYDARNREQLYILNFYLPRFMDVGLREKISTIIHELWHVSPAFNGDIRRHNGRCYAHTGSQDAYDAKMDTMADQWLGLAPPHSVYRFLRLSFPELQAAYGGVIGTRVRHPKLIPLTKYQANQLAAG